MKILVTGAKGFIGKHIILSLRSLNETVLEYDRDTTEELETLVLQSDVIIHLAGINRPIKPEEFYDGNTNLTMKLIESIKKAGKLIPVILSSSIQAEKDNDYGKSKRMAENQLFQFSKETENPVAVYRFANVFGKWCQPNYNSVVATFCHNIAHDLPIQVHDRNAMIPFVYIDDVVKTIIHNIHINHYSNTVLSVDPIYYRSLGELVDLLESFKRNRTTLFVANMQEEFGKKLYATYLSYLPIDQFSYPVVMHCDHRGSFSELLKSEERGQVSVNISKANIVKGNHWHHTKNEKFIVVSGKGVIRFRKIGTKQVKEYFVCGDKLEVVDIPTGYTHNIENLSESDLITVMWASEVFDPQNPDTFYEEV